MAEHLRQVVQERGDSDLAVGEPRPDVKPSRCLLLAVARLVDDFPTGQPSAQAAECPGHVLIERLAPAAAAKHKKLLVRSRLGCRVAASDRQGNRGVAVGPVDGNRHAARERARRTGLPVNRTVHFPARWPAVSSKAVQTMAAAGANHRVVLPGMAFCSSSTSGTPA